MRASFSRAGRLVAGATVVLVALTACNANSTSGLEKKGVKGGQLHVLVNSPQEHMDPATSQSMGTTKLHYVHRGLTTWDAKRNGIPLVAPDLATDTGTTTDGGRTWTFHLKPGLKYETGQAITTPDIKYGVERSFAPNLSGGLGYHKSLLVGGESYKGPYTGKSLDSIQVPDPMTIVFKLNKPYGDWPWIVSMGAFSPVPRAADKNPSAYDTKPVASGPYKVKSFKQGSRLVLDRNPYWNRKLDTIRTALPDEVVIEIAQDDNVANERLISDYGADKNAASYINVPAALLPKVNSRPGVKRRMQVSASGELLYLVFNNKRAPFNNRKVRQALQYAVDKQAVQIASGGAKDGGEIATTLITPGLPGYHKFDLYPANPQGEPAKAKRLLAEAGFKSDRTLVFLVSNEPKRMAQAQAIEASLRLAGVNVQLKPEDDDAWRADATNEVGNFDLTLSGWTPDFPSAQGNIQPVYGTSEIGGGGWNMARYSNPAADRLIDAAAADPDRNKAAATWAKADELIMADAPTVPLIYAKARFLRGSNVSDFYLPPFPPYPNLLKTGLGGPLEGV